MLITQLLFAVMPNALFALLLAIVLFFCFLNTLEALLPSLVSRIAPAGSRGGASGVYSSSQFLGGFIGGAGGGWLLGQAGNTGLFIGLACVCAVWFAVLMRFNPPRKLSSHRRILSPLEQARGPELAAELQLLPGVEEVYLSPDEGAAYMKVDKNVFRSGND